MRAIDNGMHRAALGNNTQREIVEQEKHTTFNCVRGKDEPGPENPTDTVRPRRENRCHFSFSVLVT